VAGSVIGDPQPAFDKCSTRETVSMSGKNIGDLLNTKGVSWGWFQALPAMQSLHIGSAAFPGRLYSHHHPFQYYTSTANQRMYLPRQRR